MVALAVMVSLPFADGRWGMEQRRRRDLVAGGCIEAIDPLNVLDVVSAWPASTTIILWLAGTQ